MYTEAAVMILGIVIEGDVMSPHFFPKGLVVNAADYKVVVDSIMRPWIDCNIP